MTKNRVVRVFAVCLLAGAVFFGMMPAFIDSVFAAESSPLVNETIKTVMFKKDTVAKSSSELIAALDEKVEKYATAQLLGETRNGLAKVLVDGLELYVEPTSFVSHEDEIHNLIQQKEREEEEARKKAEEEKRRKEEEEQERLKKEKEEEEAKKVLERALKEAMNPTWDGGRLTASRGVIYGPNGKETYYNLPMNGVVSIMRRMGNTDEYWVREDGVKMLGDYVMVAADLNIRPRGSLIMTSLGLGIVCDTGTFTAANPTQLDIATTW